MVYHAWFAATKARCVARCVVATDEDDVQSAAVGFGAVVVRVDPYEEGMSARHAKRDKSTQKAYGAAIPIHWGPVRIAGSMRTDVPTYLGTNCFVLVPASCSRFRLSISRAPWY